MSTYVPDPEDVNTPYDFDNIGNVSPPEIRALKQHIIDKFAELDGILQAYSTEVMQAQSTKSGELTTQLNTLTTNTATALGYHVEATDNPHGTTKSHIGLSALQNYGISDSVASASTTTYASAKAAKTINDAITTLTSTYNTLNSSVATLVGNTNNVITYGSNSATLLQELQNKVKGSMVYFITELRSTSTWKNTTPPAVFVIEARRVRTANENCVHVILPNASYSFNFSTTARAVIFGQT